MSLQIGKLSLFIRMSSLIPYHLSYIELRILFNCFLIMNDDLLLVIGVTVGMIILFTLINIFYGALTSIFY